jgi:hypothetical protein
MDSSSSMVAGTRTTLNGSACRIEGNDRDRREGLSARPSLRWRRRWTAEHPADTDFHHGHGGDQQHKTYNKRHRDLHGR